MKVKNTDNAEHYIWGENCDGWHLLKSDSLSVIQEKMPPGTKESLHFHSKAQQVNYTMERKSFWHHLLNHLIDL